MRKVLRGRVLPENESEENGLLLKIEREKKSRKKRRGPYRKSSMVPVAKRKKKTL